MDQLVKTYIDLQENHKEIYHQLSQAKHNTSATSTNKQTTTLMIKELSTVPDSTNVYKSLGKMFIISSVPEISKELNQELVRHKDALKQWEDVGKSLGVKLNDLETQLKELSVKITNKK